jgi:hypothetical protein
VGAGQEEAGPGKQGRQRVHRHAALRPAQRDEVRCQRRADSDGEHPGAEREHRQGAGLQVCPGGDGGKGKAHAQAEDQVQQGQESGRLEGDRRTCEERSRGKGQVRDRRKPGKAPEPGSAVTGWG